MLGWWFLVVMGNMFERKSQLPNGFANAPKMDLPPIQVLYSVTFGLFLVLFLVRMGSALFRSPGFYRPADVDVLFSTPVSPRAVLLHRFVLDYLLTLLLPLLLLIFGGRGSTEGIQYLFKNLPDPNSAPLVGKTILLSFLLLTLFSVSLSYAVGMYINRDMKLARLVRKVLLGFCWLIVFGLATVIISAFWSDSPAKELLGIPQSPYVHYVLFPVSLASELAVSPLYGTWTAAWIAMTLLLTGSALCIYLATRQTSWLYDMAAKESASIANRRAIQQTGDLTLAFTKRAQEGKMKARKFGFLLKMKLKGMWAILWREALLSLRTQTSLIVVFAISTTGVGLLAMYDTDANSKFGNIMLPLQTFLLITSTMAISQSGFMETLRRVDCQKPLPFSSLQMCFMEVIGKSFGPLLISFLVVLVNLIVMPSNVQLWLTALIGLPSIALLVTGVQFLVILLFPDVDDPTQRTFRGMVQLLGSLFAVGPSLVAFGLLVFVKSPLVIAAIVGCGINVAILLLVNSFSAMRYEVFNPSD